MKCLVENVLTVWLSLQGKSEAAHKGEMMQDENNSSQSAKCKAHGFVRSLAFLHKSWEQTFR